jgi:hypothetical protein
MIALKSVFARSAFYDKNTKVIINNRSMVFCFVFVCESKTLLIEKGGIN